MTKAALRRLRGALAIAFAERHLYLRAGGRLRGLVLSPARQAIIALGLTCLALWSGGATLGMVIAARAASAAAAEAARARALFAQRMEGHDARLIAEVSSIARVRADRLRDGLGLAGVTPEAARKLVTGGQGGPFIAPDDPRARAAMADLDRRLAPSMLNAARAVREAETLTDAAAALPLAHPTNTAPLSSSFGLRTDPFTGERAFHPGLDFPAPRMTPVYATAAGVVDVVGDQAGYGRTIEIVHAGGFRTRFAHLAAARVKVGERVAPHQVIGAVGSTGRSTGPHLHYEIWKGGRLQNPSRFLEAGDHVGQAG